MKHNGESSSSWNFLLVGRILGWSQDSQPQHIHTFYLVIQSDTNLSTAVKEFGDVFKILCLCAYSVTSEMSDSLQHHAL